MILLLLHGALVDSLWLILYCGVGFFSLALAKAHGHVYGIEFLAGAVERARENASLNGLKARFFSDDVADGLPRLREALRRKRPFVVVDPARRGLEEGVIDELIVLNPAGIAYIFLVTHEHSLVISNNF